MITVNSNFTNVQFNTSLGVLCEMTIDNVFQDLEFEYIVWEFNRILNKKDSIKPSFIGAEGLAIYLNDNFPEEDHEDILNLIRTYGNEKMKNTLGL